MSTADNSRNKLSFARETRGAWDVVRLSGTLDEHATAPLGQLQSDRGRPCAFNFHGIKAINSSGVRIWIMFLRKFSEQHAVQFEECPPIVVEQMNMVPGFFGKAKVASIYVAFTCEGCGFCQDQLVNAEDYPVKTGKSLAPVSCPKCAGRMQFEDNGEFNCLSGAA